MGAIASLLYGILAYILFLLTFLYAIGFVGNFLVPKSIDSGAVAPLAETLVVNVLLLGLFAFQHSLMARAAFKRWWTRGVPPAIERSTYVLFASLILILLFWQWRPLPEAVWTVTGPVGVAVLTGAFWLGWALVLISTFLISHFELFGLRQVLDRYANRETPPMTFRTPLLYMHVRHPIYLGFIIAFWATPVMSVGHLLFAVATTGYILIGVYFEERDLIATFGDEYRRYRARVGMLIPRPRRKHAAASEGRHHQA